MNIDIVTLLEQNPILLIFVVLAIGLGIGKLQFGRMHLGSAFGVLMIAIVMCTLGFTFIADP